MTSPGPHAVRTIEHVRIPLRDGIALAARVWMPDDPAALPVPAVLEAQPYRKGDVMALDDSRRHPYVAAHGYACLRVDLRGAGDSEGLPLDEYHRQEQEDLLDVIAWIADQPWCTGAVGMTGISWSGFNSLQLAARRPPALKAIVTACSTDDRYDNDVHYLGGSPLGYYLLPWSTAMLAFACRPPDPATVGEGWRQQWLARMESAPHLIETWLGHQRRDDYWAGGSVCEDYGALDCPVLAVGGWADAYTDAILRLLEHLEAPAWGLIGPWGHTWPQDGVPGPAVGFLQECVRWWDRWLKGERNGVDEQSRLRAWMPRPGTRPEQDRQEGRWLALDGWPATGVRPRSWPLAGDGQLRDPDAAAGPPPQPRSLCSPQTVGVDAGAWCGYGLPGDAAGDQRRDDARSLCWDSAPLERPVEMVGPVGVRLRVAVDRPVAFLAVRLVDVAPDGRASLVARGILNLCHRDGHDAPQRLEPGSPVEVTVPLKAVAHAFGPGHRLRVAVSTSFWPWIWPVPEPVTATVLAGALELPTWTRPASEDPPVTFAPPESAPPLAVELLRPPSPHVRVVEDQISGVTCYEMARDFVGVKRFGNGLRYEDADPVRLIIGRDDPTSAVVEADRSVRLSRGDWEVRIEVRSRMTADADHFHATSTVTAYEAGDQVFTTTHDCRVPRDHC
ncbi:CocE/NonD family hydrolase [Patulibacter defluvii]|uniref:CocE/NonD family hydrolase n=1 Tax=Patulibacter defluvii TaxID=3095358 RepID=UPI002A751DF4|nr:CocE/NonD family hydrolase [Patulibacter sp. DM4]